jgi:hypothetical protein
LDLFAHQADQVSQSVVLEVAWAFILELRDNDRRIGYQIEIRPRLDKMPQHFASVSAILGVRNEEYHSPQGEVRLLPELVNGIDFGPATAGCRIEYGKLAAKFPPPTALERVLERHGIRGWRIQPIDLAQITVEQACPDRAKKRVWVWFHGIALAGS